MENSAHQHRTNIAGLLVALGIIYGDIGTSPLYVLKSILKDQVVTEDLVLGGLSCIVWTLTLLTTIKYVFITLNADNHGEGGIFSLYALVRRFRPKLIFPAILGGAALLADGMITPPISVSSAVEGLLILNPDIPTIPIVVTIITLLFLLQRVGTSVVGKTFGPFMLVWFLMLGFFGILFIGQNPFVLKALNPWYAYNLLVNFEGGFWFLGAVFLCSTGAEALYSDLGHCGKENIRISWGFVKLCLILNYMGQGAWVLNTMQNKILPASINPFYAMMPQWFLPIGIVIASLAAIIASQALISGSFTLVSEAMRLNVWPKVKIKFPSELKGQLYVPSVNWILYAGCMAIVFYFKESSAMEAAYGLAITLAMLMTTYLLSQYLITKRVNRFWIGLLLLVYISLEFSFFIANVVKFTHGGWVSLLISIALMTIMYVWYQGKRIKNRYITFTHLHEHLDTLKELSSDTSIPKFATHLVYLTSSEQKDVVESKIMYSIFQKQPKRADIYWFVHIHVDDKPYTQEYQVEILANNDVIKIEFTLGFRIEQKVNFYFRKVVEDLVANGEIDISSRYASLAGKNKVGDFSFIVIKRHLSYENDLPILENLIMDGYFLLDSLSLSEDKAFGLDTSSVKIEKVPLIISPPKSSKLKRTYPGLKES
jgi:KUP system potassium uptake protein